MDYKKINDYETLYLIGEQDDESVQTIFEKYRPIVVAIAKKYYTKMNYHCGDLDDFIQEGYIGLDRAMKSFKEQRNALFYTFASVCIERQIRGYCRSFLTLKNENIYHALSVDFELEENLRILDAISDPSILNNPDQYLEEGLQYEHLIEFKHNLTVNQSCIFELRYNGFKYKEISKLLDVPLSTVDNCLHLCRKKLANNLTFL